MTQVCRALNLFHRRTTGCSGGGQLPRSSIEFRGSPAPHQLSALDKVSALADQYQPGQRQQRAKSYTLSAANRLTLQFPPQREIGRTEVGIIRSRCGRKAGVTFFFFSKFDAGLF